jgi:hypothetical protein
MKASDVLSLDLDGFYNLEFRAATNVFMNKEPSLKNIHKNKNSGGKFIYSSFQEVVLLDWVRLLFCSIIGALAFSLVIVLPSVDIPTVLASPELI